MSPTPTAAFLLGRVACSTHSVTELVDEVRELLLDKTLYPRTLLCVNAHIYNLAVADPALLDALNRSRATVADGMAIVWASRLFGHRVHGRCNMTEAYHSFLRDGRMPRNRAVLIGCSEDEAAAAAIAANRVSRHCRIESHYPGFLAEAEYERILGEHADTDLILIGMGTPRTERLTQKAARMCPRSIVWGIGGGTIRIDAGTLAEAPAVWRHTGLQWLFRLGREPRALWRRYLLGNPLFAARIVAAALGRWGHRVVDPS